MYGQKKTQNAYFNHISYMRLYMSYYTNNAICICMYVRMMLKTLKCMYVCMYVCTSTMPTKLLVEVYVCMCLWIMYVCMYDNKCMCMCVCISSDSNGRLEQVSERPPGSRRGDSSAESPSHPATQGLYPLTSRTWNPLIKECLKKDE
jgi:hypothetical protein